MNDASNRILSGEELKTLIRRKKEMTEKLEASLRGGRAVSGDEIAEAQDDFRKIMESFRDKPDLRDALGEVSALMLRQMEAVRHLQDERGCHS